MSALNIEKNVIETGVYYIRNVFAQNTAAVLEGRRDATGEEPVVRATTDGFHNEKLSMVRLSLPHTLYPHFHVQT